MNSLKRSNTKLAGRTQETGRRLDLQNDNYGDPNPALLLNSNIDKDKPLSIPSTKSGGANQVISSKFTINAVYPTLRSQFAPNSDGDRPIEKVRMEGPKTTSFSESKFTGNTEYPTLRSQFGPSKDGDRPMEKMKKEGPKTTLWEELCAQQTILTSQHEFDSEVAIPKTKPLDNTKTSTSSIPYDSNKLTKVRSQSLASYCTKLNSKRFDIESRSDNGGDRKTSTTSRSHSADSNVNGAQKPHTGGDGRWEAIQWANSRESPLGLSHFRALKRLGYGDIGSVYLVELRGTSTFFAMKVMDKSSLVSRNKVLRAQTEREILGLLDHPFLPTLYSHFETEKFYCFVMEYCSGGNLHSLRQRQPNKYFTEQAARFYASEVLLAIEYLHMLGIIYRDLKPENVLVREGGHIMLSDFDLSLRCSVCPKLVKSTTIHVNSNTPNTDNSLAPGCIQPSSFFPRILPKKKGKSKSDFGPRAESNLELLAEPSSARSMSFVGTHEYLAPEIICGEGHGSAVDWWTFGIFLYELLHGTTPFKGPGHRATLSNVVGQPLRFPEAPSVTSSARDLIKGLLVKNPHQRIAYKRGATEIKQHPFFEGVNWALVRCAVPPHVPDPVDLSVYASKDGEKMDIKGMLAPKGICRHEKKNSDDSSYLHFDYF